MAPTDLSSNSLLSRLHQALHIAMKHFRHDDECGSTSYGSDGTIECACGKSQDRRRIAALFSDDEWKDVHAGRTPDEPFDAQWLRSEIQHWRDNAFEAAAAIADRWGAGDAAGDIRALVSRKPPQGECTNYAGVDLTRHPALKEAYRIAGLIEACGASPALTTASCAAFDFIRTLDKFLDETHQTQRLYGEGYICGDYDPPAKLPATRLELLERFHTLILGGMHEGEYVGQSPEEIWDALCAEDPNYSTPPPPGEPVAYRVDWTAGTVEAFGFTSPGGLRMYVRELRDDGMLNIRETPLYRRTQPPGREWQPMTTAPRDQTPVLLLVNDAPGSPLYRAGGLQFVGKWVSDVSEWCFAAPVGYGGIPDAWLLGWMPLPASRPTKSVNQEKNDGT